MTSIPQKASGGSHFYIIQGEKITDKGLDEVENNSLDGRKIPADQRAAYKTIGGTPFLDQDYTIFGEVVSGLAVLDSIAAVKTTENEGGDSPIEPVRIISAR